MDLYGLVSHCGAQSPALEEKVQLFYSTLLQAVPWSWASSSGAVDALYAPITSASDVKLGVFYNVFLSSSVMDVSHSESYIHGNRSTGQCDFVMEYEGYVPTIGKSTSLLDKLCYAVF